MRRRFEDPRGLDDSRPKLERKRIERESPRFAASAYNSASHFSTLSAPAEQQHQQRRPESHPKLRTTPTLGIRARLPRGSTRACRPFYLSRPIYTRLLSSRSLYHYTASPELSYPPLFFYTLIQSST